MKTLQIFAVILVCASVCLSIQPAQAQNNPAPALFTPLDQADGAITQAAQIARARAVQVDTGFVEILRQAVEEGNFDKAQAVLPFFEDATYTAQFDLLEYSPTGGYILSGFLTSFAESEVTLSVQDGVIALNAAVEARLYQLCFSGEGYEARQVDQSGYPAEALPIPVAFDDPGEPVIADPEAVTGAIIDVMVVYTTAARTAAGGTSAIEALINLAGSETNTGYANSQVTQRINLVHVAEVAYSEAGFDFAQALYDLQGTSDGEIDNVHSLRNTYGADLVVMIVEGNYQYCGIGFLMTSGPSTSFAPYAFTVVARNCATGYYSFAHEMGHNMGSHHDHNNADGALYPYSYGYQDPTNAFRTIMAYNCASGCPRVNYWSNPDVQYGGRTTGIADYADNHRSLNNTAATVAAFRANPVPSAPGSLAATTPAAAGQIRLTWQDNSSNETGFKIERSPQGANTWVQIATVGANVTTYTNSGLPCGSSYDYRARAYNANGNSPYSNTATGQTIICLPPAPSGLSALPSGQFQVNLTWTDNSTNESSFTVERSPDGATGWAVVASLPANSNTYNNTDLFCQMDYYYRVRASNAAGSSAYSNTAHAVTASCTAPIAPESCEAKPYSIWKFQVSWPDTPNEHTYTVEVSLNGVNGWILAGTVPGNTLSYLHTGTDLTRYYRIQSHNPAGDSLYSPVCFDTITFTQAIFLPVVSK